MIFKTSNYVISRESNKLRQNSEYFTHSESNKLRPNSEYFTRSESENVLTLVGIFCQSGSAPAEEETSGRVALWGSGLSPFTM